MAGSDKRRRLRQFLVGWTDEEFKEISAKAVKAGLSTAAFIRSCALGDPEPLEVSPEVRDLLERADDMALAYGQLLVDAEATGNIDRARLRDCLTAYGQIRRDLLTALDEDPDSEDLMPLPVELHDV
ncbi:MAG TPA: hypothetical protein VG028_05485 [Terriglobia bacterium]|nr:hypothetical protein [Terriglobia bacterium]